MKMKGPFIYKGNSSAKQGTWRLTNYWLVICCLDPSKIGVTRAFCNLQGKG